MAQLSFEGMEASESRLGIGNAGDLPCKGQYVLGDLVSGTWSGRIVKVIGHDKGEAGVQRKHIVSVDSDSFTIGKV